MLIGCGKSITGLWKVLLYVEIYLVLFLAEPSGLTFVAISAHHVTGSGLRTWLLMLERTWYCIRLKKEHHILGFAAPDAWLANPALPDDILKEAVPGNIRRAKHFVAFLKRILQYIKGRFQTEHVESQGPVSFLTSMNKEFSIDQKTLRFCYDRLQSLLLTLEITDTDEFHHIQTICDFATLVGTYSRGVLYYHRALRWTHAPHPWSSFAGLSWYCFTKAPWPPSVQVVICVLSCLLPTRAWIVGFSVVTSLSLLCWNYCLLPDDYLSVLTSQSLLSFL